MLSLCVYVLSVNSDRVMSRKVIPSAFARPIIVKFLTNENMKRAEIIMRLRAQFGDETLSWVYVYDWSVI
jgi:hypothetical protein